MLKKVLIGALGLFGLVVAVLAGVIAARPSAWRVERALALSAPPSAVHRQISDFRAWGDWSPWARLEPEMRTTVQGVGAGVGAGYAWAGTARVGEGRLTITEADPRHVVMRLELLRPWASSGTVEFRLSAIENGTRVTWSVEGDRDLAGKALWLVGDVEPVLGGDLEKGLKQLGRAAVAAVWRQPFPAPHPDP